MNRLQLTALLAPLCLAVPAEAARVDASAGLRVAASVVPFCQLSVAHSVATELVDGRAEIGMVREVCNTAAGYEVRADFTNLAGGTVTAGSDSMAVDALGNARFTYAEARHQRRLWRLRDACARQDGPVVVRLSITPL